MNQLSFVLLACLLLWFIKFTVFGVVYHVVFHMPLASLEFFIAAFKHMKIVFFMNHILTQL